MAELDNYVGTVKISSGLACKNGYDYPLIEAHSVLIDNQDGRLDRKISQIDELIANGGNVTVNGFNISNFRGHNTGFQYQLAIQANANAITTEGHYFMLFGNNLPTSLEHGLLDIDYYDGTDFTPSGNANIKEFVVKQTFRPWDTNDIYVRTYKSFTTTWSEWEKIDFKAMEIEKGTLSDIASIGFTGEYDGITTSEYATAGVQSDTSLRFNYEAYAPIPAHRIPVMENSISKFSITATSDNVPSGQIRIWDQQYVYDEANSRIIISAYLNTNYPVKFTLRYKYKLALANGEAGEGGAAPVEYVDKIELASQITKVRKEVRREVVEEVSGSMLQVPFELELGTFNWKTGELEDATDAVRFAKSIDVNKRTAVSLQGSEYLEYGYVRYDSNGHVVEVVNWLPMDSGGDITFEGGGSVLFKFRHTDQRDMNEDDISYFFGYVSISTEGGLEYLDNKIEAVAASIGDISSALDELHAYAQNLVLGVSE